MNPTLVKRALEKIPDRHVLVNVISRRVRQLNSPGGEQSAPMISDSANMSAADIALLEVIDGHMNIEMPAIIALTRPSRNGNRPRHWAAA